MKTKILGLLAAGLLAGPIAAQATITVTYMGASGSGPSNWTYVATFINSTLNPGDFFTINDFGAATVVTGLGTDWTFSQALGGPNSLPASDDASLLNATFTWTGARGTVISPNPVTPVDLTFVLMSPLAANGIFAEYTSIDQRASGAVAGTDLKVIGSTTVPIATPALVPEPGTLALLGLGLAGMGLSRRRKS